jgi:hypothetical protein
MMAGGYSRRSLGKDTNYVTFCTTTENVDWLESERKRLKVSRSQFVDELVTEHRILTVGTTLKGRKRAVKP